MPSLRRMQPRSAGALRHGAPLHAHAACSPRAPAIAGARQRAQVGSRPEVAAGLLHDAHLLRAHATAPQPSQPPCAADSTERGPSAETWKPRSVSDDGCTHGHPLSRHAQHCQLARPSAHRHKQLKGRERSKCGMAPPAARPGCWAAAAARGAGARAPPCGGQPCAPAWPARRACARCPGRSAHSAA